MKNLINSQDLTKIELEKLFVLSDKMNKRQKKYDDSLKGFVIATLFYEPSTRTRLSFESAIQKLGAGLISTENAKESGYSDEIAESDNNAVKKEGGENKIETYKNCIDNDINMMNSESKGDIHNDDKAKDSPSLENSIQKETFKKEKMKNTRKRN